MRLVLFDISGIQRFIFSTNRLREIVGASTLVKDALEQLLPEVLPKAAGASTQAWHTEGKFAWENSNVRAQIMDAGFDKVLLVNNGMGIAAATAGQYSATVCQ